MSKPPDENLRRYLSKPEQSPSHISSEKAPLARTNTHWPTANVLWPHGKSLCRHPRETLVDLLSRTLVEILAKPGGLDEI